MLVCHTSDCVFVCCFALQYNFSCNIPTLSAGGSLRLLILNSMPCFSASTLCWLLNINSVFQYCYWEIWLQQCPFATPAFTFSGICTTMDISDSLRYGGFAIVVGSPTFMCNLWMTRNTILPRVALVVLSSVASNKVAGFGISGRLTATICVTRPNWCSLSLRAMWALTSALLLKLSHRLPSERKIWWYGTLIHIGCLYLHTPRGAPDSQIELYNILNHWFIFCESVAFFDEKSSE